MTATEKTLDVAGIADVLGVTPETAWRWARTGKIPASQPGGQGGKWIFYESAVREHLSRPADPWKRSPRSRAARRRAA